MPMDSYRDGHHSMPPRHVYSANIENTLDEPVTVTGNYQTPPDGSPTPFGPIAIAAGATATIDQLRKEIGLLAV